MPSAYHNLALWLLFELRRVDGLGEFIEQGTFVAVLERVHRLAQIHIDHSFMVVPGIVAVVAIWAAGN